MLQYRDRHTNLNVLQLQQMLLLLLSLLYYVIISIITIIIVIIITIIIIFQWCVVAVVVKLTYLLRSISLVHHSERTLFCDQTP